MTVADAAGHHPHEDALTVGDGDARPLEWPELPASVRTAVITIAAHALGTVPADQIPAALVPVARFTPAKRARLGAGALSRVLEQDPGFRALAAQQLPDEPPEPVDGDPVAAAARAFLLRLPDARDVVAAAARVDEVVTLRSQVAELTTAVDKLAARLARLTAAGEAAPSRDHDGRPARSGRNGGAPPDRPDELTRLRHRLREQGSRAKAAERAAQAEVAQAQSGREHAEARAAREQANAENWRLRAERESHRADRAREALDRLREESGQRRADTDRRIDLLLQTVEQAAAGLRHEWRLVTGGAEPADLVARELPDVEPQHQRSVDGPLLLAWLKLPQAHLVVDGYNVTKTGYPELSLADQRDRLIRSLGALAARSGAEVTVVFDGAAVVAAAPSVRGVRVLFSPPDVIADDVIRQLAAAEPTGRVLVVVSSDREVVDGVRRSGARTAPSAVLLTLLS